MEGLYRAKFHDYSWAFGFYANRKETTYCFQSDCVHGTDSKVRTSLFGA